MMEDPLVTILRTLERMHRELREFIERTDERLIDLEDELESTAEDVETIRKKVEENFP